MAEPEAQQALIAVGGKASRLRNGGVDVPISKSFMTVSGQPFLYWTLISLNCAGYTRLVIAGNSSIQLREAELVLGRLPFNFAEVLFFQDPGLGVHGLPYHARSLLGRQFLFECGHSIMRPNHYRMLSEQKQSDNVVFSAFVPHPENPRQSVYLENCHVRLGRTDQRSFFAVAHPLLLDQSYAEKLPYLHFDISRIIAHYAMRSQLRYVMSTMPPEFDLIHELEASMPIYEDYLTRERGLEKELAGLPSD